MTRLPSTSLNFTHIRNMSPQSSLPTVPTASAPAISPTFFGCLIASAILLPKSSMAFIHLLHMISRQIGIDLQTPRIDATRHRTDILKSVPRKKCGGIHATVAVMADKNYFPLLRPFGHHRVHEILSEKCRTGDVDSVPLFPGANVNDLNLFTGFKPLGDFYRRDLHLPIRFLAGDYGRDDILHRQVFVPRADGRQSFSWAESAARAS